MKKGNRCIVLFVFVLILGLTLASCCPRMDAQQKTERIFIKRLDKTAAKLNLSPAQKTEFTKLKTGIRETFQEGRQTKQESLKKIKEEAAQEQPDIKKMTRLLQGVFDDETQRINRTFDLMVEFMPKLDEVQKRELTQMISSWVSKWD